MNNKKTSSKISKIASQVLIDKNSSKIQKSLAASALSQSNTNKQTSINMEKIASNVLKSNKYNENTKSLAASILSQSEK